MHKYILIFFLSFFIGCKDSSVSENHVEVIIEKGFQLYKSKKEVCVLILFPGFGGGGAENTKNEFKILEKASKRDISVLMMDFDHHVFLKNAEKMGLKIKLEQLFEKHKISYKNVYIGGFSAGGNVSLLLSNYLIKSRSKISPKGVFIVDSPIDLLKIYKNSEKNIRLNHNAESVEESKWIIENFNKDFGNPSKGIQNYELNSPFTQQTLNLTNVSALKTTKIRFYTEPDIVWWKKHNGNGYEDLNAFSIEKMAEAMKKQQFLNVEVIKTSNKGYRANGDKHPHSWSIVDGNDLLDWMTEK